MVAIVLGMLSSVVTLAVFLTGKPSIHHFLPILPTTRRRLPSPFVKWRFVVRDDALFLRTGRLEVTLLAGLASVGEYRIFVSGKPRKIMVVYRNQYEKVFKHLILANFDGSARQVHSFWDGVIVDARWFDSDSYLVFLQPDFAHSYPRRYPGHWYEADPQAIGVKAWFDADINEGNYLVSLDKQNEVSRIRRY